jgi:hypothetical protein
MDAEPDQARHRLHAELVQWFWEWAQRAWGMTTINNMGPFELIQEYLHAYYRI